MNNLVIINKLVNIIRNKIVPLTMAALVLSAGLLAGCAQNTVSNSGEFANVANADSDAGQKLEIVATIFPAYDFARNIAGDKANVHQLLKPGTESHSYEPTPQDMILIRNCDVFIYAGGESDTWIESIIDAADISDKIVISMMDCVTLLNEEEKEGMHEGGLLGLLSEDDGEEEMDEHVWTSPKNAIKISECIAEGLAKADSSNKEIYFSNFSSYEKQLTDLDESFRKVINESKRKKIVVADRFPFRYLCETYGLDYYAIFPGCSEDAEVTAKSLIYMSDRVKDENIPVVFYIEFSNQKIADTICEVTGARKLELNSCHNVSYEDVANGATYISKMYDNLEALSEALN